MTGGHTVYTAEIADTVLSELAAGRTLYAICRDPGMPSDRTVRLWVMEDREGFAARYSLARKLGRTGVGHPTSYTAEIADRILDELMEGRLLIDICDDPGMPTARTIRQWVQVDREGFAQRYDRARELGFHAMADQMLAIADDGRNDWTIYRKNDGTAELVLDHEHISRSKLRVNSRKWLLTKMLPRIYGDEPKGHEAESDLAKLMREVDGRTRGLPSQEERERVRRWRERGGPYIYEPRQISGAEGAAPAVDGRPAAGHGDDPQGVKGEGGLTGIREEPGGA